MSVKVPPRVAALKCLADSVQAAGCQITEDAASADLERKNRDARQANMSAILGREAVSLGDRMRWLEAHPNRRRVLGGSAIKMLHVPYREVPVNNSDPHRHKLTFDAIATPLLLAFDAEPIDGEPVRDGYVFMTPEHPKAGRADLLIERRLVAVGAGKWQRAGRYVIDAASCARGRGWAVQGDTFDEYEAATREIGADFEDIYSPDFYPNRLYNDPLGLVMQAHELLGR
jgi:hypothetical protein